MVRADIFVVLLIIGKKHMVSHYIGFFLVKDSPVVTTTQNADIFSHLSLMLAKRLLNYWAVIWASLPHYLLENEVSRADDFIC